jgi:hypothetical protein
LRAGLVFFVLLLGIISACSPAQPEQPATRRQWRGPVPLVSSEGLEQYARREIAQTVAFPRCIFIGTTPFRFAAVDAQPTGAPVPAGLQDTGYGLDRWRLLARPGLLAEQDTIFVSVRGSTGILGRYERLASAEAEGC